MPLHKISSPLEESPSVIAERSPGTELPSVVLESVVNCAAAPFVLPSYARTDDQEYIGFYRPDRWLAVGSRQVGTGPWQVTQLETRLGWDSHNYVDLAVDPRGGLHVAANMHSSEMCYFRSEVAGDARTLVRVPAMVDRAREMRVTYPRFFTRGDGELAFTFREGGSGRGDQWLYALDSGSGRWREHPRGPVIVGEGVRSAYLDSDRPHVGPDGRHHVVWVWRDSPDASSTHTVCYASSSDLLEWQNGDGRPLALPLRYSSDVVVADIPPGSGLINNNVRLGFDASGDPLIAAHLHDEAGRQQVVIFRRDDGVWSGSQITAWNVAWAFGGGGSIDFEIEMGTPFVDEDDVVLDVRHRGDVVRLRITDWESCEASRAPTPAAGILVGADEGALRRHWLRGDPPGAGRWLTWTSAPPARDREVDVDATHGYLSIATPTDGAQ